MKWETVIGLEVHAQLNTRSKLFSDAKTAYGASPNSQTSFVDAGFPGVLPVLNRQAVILAIKFGLAVEASIHPASYFERKHYFYPDLPKGYQISQYRCPIIRDGRLEILIHEGHSKWVCIERAHLEEDAGKSLHDTQHDYTGIDLNRAGIPLLEIVTTPCLYSAQEVVCYLKTLHQLLVFLEVCDGNMQMGSFRCDVNISIRPKGSKALGVRTELKNLNSFRFVEKAILFEERRHQDILEQAGTLLQETRLYSPQDNRTYAMRGKESDKDYRYCPDPDLLPVHISNEMLAEVQQAMPELPASIRRRLIQQYGFSSDDLAWLLDSPALIRYFDAVMSYTQASAKMVLNWLKGPYAAALNEMGATFELPPVSSRQLATLLNKISDKSISNAAAKQIFTQLLRSKAKTIDELIAEQDKQPSIDKAALEGMVRDMLKQHPEQVADFRAGKHKLRAFFVGQVMKVTQGQADPADIQALLNQYLK